jgi:hypothetical protein
MNTLWVVDSIEENTAAVEQDGGTVYQIPRLLLPKGVKEGDVCQVTIKEGANPAALVVTVSIDEKATTAAKQRSAAQVAMKPKSNDPGGPIKL